MEGYVFLTEQPVIWRDLDALGHVNNAVYATYFETSRMKYLTVVSSGETLLYQLILAELTITFKSPAFLGEILEVGVRATELRNSSFIMESQIQERESGRLVAFSRSVLVHYDYSQKRSVPIPAQWREAMASIEGRSL